MWRAMCTWTCVYCRGYLITFTVTTLMKVLIVDNRFRSFLWYCQYSRSIQQFFVEDIKRRPSFEIKWMSKTISQMYRVKGFGERRICAYWCTILKHRFLNTVKRGHLLHVNTENKMIYQSWWPWLDCAPTIDKISDLFMIIWWNGKWTAKSCC